MIHVISELVSRIHCGSIDLFYHILQALKVEVTIIRNNQKFVYRTGQNEKALIINSLRCFLHKIVVCQDSGTMHVSFYRCNKHLLLLRWNVKTKHLKVLNSHLLSKYLCHSLDDKRPDLRCVLNSVLMKLLRSDAIVIKHLVSNKDRTGALRSLTNHKAVNNCHILDVLMRNSLKELSVSLCRNNFHGKS